MRSKDNLQLKIFALTMNIIIVAVVIAMFTRIPSKFFNLIFLYKNTPMSSAVMQATAATSEAVNTPDKIPAIFMEILIKTNCNNRKIQIFHEQH